MEGLCVLMLCYNDLSPLHSWDEWVPDERVLKWNDTNLQKQQQLKEMHSRRKPSRTSAAHTSTTTEGSESRSRKRNRDASTEKSRIVRTNTGQIEDKLWRIFIIKGGGSIGGRNG